ncbi:MULTISPECIES: hypothetical protein [unclassified Rhizobium]|uniref:hypothetical protein n=1 Tax=unclassified Rhizobium TaxID=2613769 RepID=UPI00161C1F0F|nr:MULTISPECIES: hypothetical protein [unclassified Rhizobium]MBB3287562.1 hypothetical protein [Rhizobium sp. BK252]MBB3402302.1 hypothetical protein [Rhizobium sp. BK289]MBB3414879.1 hypothetical protein [Rhizobium sp. BK284]MBB3482768.1 hypothetical protein [Rhizobium sp. BK347]MDK4721843.1 hypothetical protein [Rhizobium sp. CNPSo 3968]
MALPHRPHPAIWKGINVLAFLKPSCKTARLSKDKLNRREALLLNSYNLRNVVNNSLSLPEVLTFYFGSAVSRPDILASRRDLSGAGEGPHCVDVRPPVDHLHQNFNACPKFDVYANVNIL